MIGRVVVLGITAAVQLVMRSRGISRKRAKNPRGLRQNEDNRQKHVGQPCVGKCFQTKRRKRKRKLFPTPRRTETLVFPTSAHPKSGNGKSFHPREKRKPWFPTQMLMETISVSTTGSGNGKNFQSNKFDCTVAHRRTRQIQRQPTSAPHCHYMEMP